MNSQKIHENYHEVKEKLSNVFKRLMFSKKINLTLL